ncbi:protein O-mannosyl-transferase TMTC2-like isoform X2 [Haliotis rufescens]|uniref:protein O-mannosyl-transferase TMTC2-like isoform X2 n=1 Tax=Haliotis rufescens TaxID=6454 RepID=UPI001EB02CA8|nr:protein O-mannosyl-transferase TMTC2-like isoform X2 [Haliotis rufescens]
MLRQRQRMDYPVLAACLVSLCLYLNTLDADFAYDDSRAIQKNQDLLPETPLVNIFFDDFWGTPLTHSGSHKSYRPLCVLSFRFNYALGKLNPWGYHLGNVLLHAMVTAVFTCLAQKVLKRKFATYVAGLLFAAHPIHTEAVAGIVGRADIGACLFFLLTFLSYMKYVEYRTSAHMASHRWLYVVSVCVFTVASLLTKEQAIAVLGVCATYDVFVFHRVKLQEILQLHIFTMSHFRGLCEGLVLLATCGISLVATRIYFMGNKPPEFAPSDNPASDSDCLMTRFLTYHFLPTLNIWLLLCPSILSFDWSMESVPLVERLSDYRNVYTVIMYISIAYFAQVILKQLNQTVRNPYLGLKTQMNGNGVHHNVNNGKINPTNCKPRLKRRESASSSENEELVTPSSVSAKHSNVLIVSLAIIIFPFIPASNLFFYVGFVIAERILYIPSMGFCLLIAEGAEILYSMCSSPGKRRLVLMAVAVILMLFSAKTVSRNFAWHTEEKLYTSGIKVNPAKAWGNLANVWNEQGRTSDAEEAYRNALRYRGNMADVHYNLGILLQEQKRFHEALESYQRAIHYRPKLSMAHLNLGILTAQFGQNENAAKIYRHCADLDTSGLKDPRLHEATKISCLYNLGRLYTEEERYQEALSVYEEALKRRPSHYAPQSLYNMMGEVYSKMGDLVTAERWYRKALKSKPDHVPAHLTIAKLLQKKKQYEEAEKWFKKASAIDSKDASIDHHYAQFLTETGRHIEAEVRYRLALSKTTPDFELLFNAANAFRQNSRDLDAEGLYRKAVILKPELPSAHMNLGAILHINGKLAEAERSYLSALKLKPDDSMTMANLQKLRNLMANTERKGTP